MNNNRIKFWPYKAIASIIVAIGLLIALLILFDKMHSTMHKLPDSSTNMILFVVLLLSLFPILLSILDVIIDRGATIGYKDLKIDFSKMQQSAALHFMIPANIGMPGVPVTGHET